MAVVMRYYLRVTCWAGHETELPLSEYRDSPRCPEPIEVEIDGFESMQLPCAEPIVEIENLGERE